MTETTPSLYDRFQSGQLTSEQAILELARQFPAMRHLVRGRWHPLALDEICASGKLSTGEEHILRFLLNVWNPGEKWKSGRFDLVNALSTLDSINRTPIALWADNPWYP